MTTISFLSNVDFLAPTVSKILTLLAVVSVSGIHLLFMQAGAWALMVWEDQRQESHGSLVVSTMEAVSGHTPCARCLVTQAASLESHDSGGEDSRNTTRTIETIDLRWIPLGFDRLRVAPPAHELTDHGLRSDPAPRFESETPPAPPPRSAATQAA